VAIKICSRGFGFITALFFVFFSLYVSVLCAEANIIDDISVAPVSDRVEIHITFNIAMRYLTHSPKERGALLQIQFLPVQGGKTSDTPVIRQGIGWKPTPQVPLTAVTYEKDPSGRSVLTLRFTDPIVFQVREGKDLRSVVISILPGKAHKADLKKISPNHADIDLKESLPTPLKDKNVKSPEVSSEASIDSSYRYSINLRSSLQPFDKSVISEIAIPDNLLLYTTRFEKDEKVWYRLRLGFFPSIKTALPVLLSLEQQFPYAWVTKVSVKERDKDAHQSQGVRSAVTEVPAISAEEVKQITQPIESTQAVPDEKVAEEEKRPELPQERIEQLVEEGIKVMTSGDYRRAIQIYTRLLHVPEEKIRQQAQEFLALARERNGQLAHAKAEYEKYLSLYPEGEGAERVSQRLAGLLTARADAKEQLRKPKKSKIDHTWQADYYGSFSQFYDYNESFTDIGGGVVNRSSLLTDLDFNTRHRNNRFDLRSQFIGGYEEDFKGSQNDETRVSTLYFDAEDKKINLSGRIGRQSRSSGGVLSRFDGGLLGYQIHPQILINLVSGYPVASVSNGIETDKYFYGISFDLGTFDKKWDFNTFFINQEVDDITDRRAVGGEVRFFHPKGSFFSLLDYDISHDELNTFLFSGNLFFKNRNSLNVMIDYRKSPILTTTNAIIGQGVESISDLLRIFSEDELRSFAKDRTATSRAYMLGGTHYFNDKFLISSNFTATKLSDTDASGGIEAFPGTGYEYFYSMQLIGSSLIKEGDIAILEFRYADTDRSDNISLSLNTRYPFDGRKWLINPRFQFDYRSNSRGSGDQVKIRPSFRLNYRVKRHLDFEFEAGAEWNDSTFFDQEEKTWGYFIFAGYRYDF
jgi:tetratricopeptide (TPR) repeat protein